jgi:probable HAF family extracellular repeat protein
MKIRKLLSLIILSSLIVLTILVMPALSQTLTYTFISIEYPNAFQTVATDINQSGQIVGAYMNADRYNHGFLFDRGKFTAINFPNSPWTVAHGINNSGEIVGTFTGADGYDHGFLWYRGAFTTIDYPGAVMTEATGINNYSQIAGLYRDADSAFHGFLKYGETFTAIDCPGATHTFVRGINDYGQLIGDCNTEFGVKVFIYDGMAFVYLDYADLGMGINNKGQIVGCYPQAHEEYTVAHGFLTNKSHYSIFSDIIFPGSIITCAHGINNKGEIVGEYSNNLDGPASGYVAMPKSGKGKN